MLSLGVGKILRELCLLERPISQAEIACSTGCSTSLVNKVMAALERKRLVHKPTGRTVAVANLEYLLLYWAFRRDIEDDPRELLETSLAAPELEEQAWRTCPQLAFTAFTAARLAGAYPTPYADVYAYDFSEGSKDFDLPKGRNSRLVLLRVKDYHLRSKTTLSSGLGVVPTRQAYVDLLSIATWEAKYAAMSLSGVDPHLPLIGSRSEMEEYL